MNVYEAVIKVLVSNEGATTIPTLWREINALSNIEKREGLDLLRLRSLIFHKSEWFKLNGDVVSIRPERDPVRFTFVKNSYPGPELKITIDFNRNTFTFFEWNFDKLKVETKPPMIKKTGSVDEFKKKLYFFEIWAWDSDYQEDGIIIDGTEWSIVLETKGAIYKSEGLDLYPREWKKVCRALTKLTGVVIN